MDGKQPEASGGYAGLLRNRRFVLAIVSSALGDGGYSLYAIAVLWLSFQLTGSLAVSGLVLLVEFGMYSITFIAGPTVDRARNLRSVLAAGYGLQALLACAIGLAVDLGQLTVPVLLVLVGAISLVWDFTWTANNALVPRIVARDDLFRANGLMGAVGGGNTIAGYAVGAALLLVVGAGDAMFLYAALQAAALLVVLPLSVPAQRTAETRVLADFWEGWRELGRGTGRPLLQLAAFIAFQGFFVQAPVLLVTLLAGLRFADPSLAYGILFASYAVGRVLGELLLGHWNPRRRLTSLMSGGMVGTGLLLVAAVDAAPLLVASAALWFLVGLVGVAFYSAFLVYLQAHVPADRFGRVLTDLYVFRGIPTAVGAAAISLLATLWGPEPLAIFIALAWTAIAVTGPTLLPALRHLEF